jgi:inosine-uridine nucleoside N-ribohydrolase
MLKQYQIMYYNNYKIPFPPIHDPCVIFYILHPEEFEASKVDKSYIAGVNRS